MSDHILQIDRYRSIHRGTIRIGEGVTAIVGPTDAGKSNICRAFRDVCFGARGVGCVEAGEPSAEVGLFIDETHGVVLTKGQKVNKYTVHDGHTQYEHVGHGSDTPEQIQREILGVFALEADKGIRARPNIAEQHDPPFLLRETESTIAKVLGSISGLHIIFAATRDAQAEVTALTRSAASAEDEVSRLSSETEAAMTNHAELARVLGEIREQMVRLGKVERTQVTVTKALGDMRGAAIRVKDARAKAVGFTWIGSIEAKLLTLASANGRYIAAASARVKIEGYSRHVDTARAKAQAVIPEGIPARLEQVAAHRTRWQEAALASVRIKTKVAAVKTAEEEVKRTEAILRLAERALGEVKVCPLCSQHIG